MKQILFVTINLVLILSITACQPGQALGPTFTPTATSTPTPTATSTPTPTLTSTITPSPTPTLQGGSEEILIEASTYFGMEPKIYKYNTRSRDVDLILTGYHLAAVSSDGSKMLVYRDPDNDYHAEELVLANIDGSSPELISSNYVYIDLIWLEETDSIIFPQEVNGWQQIYLYEPGKEIQQLTQAERVAILGDPFVVDGGFKWFDINGQFEPVHKWTSLDGEITRDIEKKKHTEFVQEEDSLREIRFYPRQVWSQDGSRYVRWYYPDPIELENGYKWYLFSKDGKYINQFDLTEVFEVIPEEGINSEGLYCGSPGDAGDAYHRAVHNGGFSPDGNQFVFAMVKCVFNAPDEIKILDFTTGEVRDVPIEFPESYNYINKIIWMP